MHGNTCRFSCTSPHGPVHRLSTFAIKQRHKVQLDTAGDDDDDEELDSDEEEEMAQRAGRLEDEDDDRETADQKRLRMAKKYLADLGDTGAADSGSSDGDGGSDDEDEDEDEDEAEDEDGDGRSATVGRKLKRARLEATGGYRRAVADAVARGAGPGGACADPAGYRWMTGHRLPLTCVALSPDDRHAFTGSKDNAIVQYDVETGARVGYLRRAWAKPGLGGGGDGAGAAGTAPLGTKARHGEVLALACSGDGRLLASGGRDKLVRLFDLRKLQATDRGDAAVASGGHGAEAGMSLTSTGGRGTRGFELRSFRGHKDAVSGVAFQQTTGSGQAGTLFSASLDRTLKLWNAKELGYVDTLFGHQADCLGVDVLRKETAVTCGRDRTARLWKWGEDKQLVFRGSAKATSLEAVRMLTDDAFVTGDDEGCVSIWSTLKKKPTMTLVATGRWAGLPPAEAQAAAAQAATADTEAAAATSNPGAAAAVASGSAAGFASPRQAAAAAAAAATHGNRPWVSSLASVRAADLVASGSSEGVVRLWKAGGGGGGDRKRGGLAGVGHIPGLGGYANGLAFASDGRFLLAAMGQEHRLGRWDRLHGGETTGGGGDRGGKARNALCLVPLPAVAAALTASRADGDAEDDE